MSVPVYTRLSTPPSSMEAILITPPELPSRPTASANAKRAINVDYGRIIQ